MPELSLASLHLSLGRLNVACSISWGSDDAPEQPVIGPPDLVDVPDLDDADPDLLRSRIGFRN